MISESHEGTINTLQVDPKEIQRLRITTKMNKMITRTQTFTTKTLSDHKETQKNQTQNKYEKMLNKWTKAIILVIFFKLQR